MFSKIKNCFCKITNRFFTEIEKIEDNQSKEFVTAENNKNTVSARENNTNIDSRSI